MSKIVKMKVQVHVMAILDHNRGGVSLAFHNWLGSHAGKASLMVNRQLNHQLYEDMIRIEK